MKSQVRKHLKFKFKHRLRQYIQSHRLGYFGSNVFIDDDVKLLRFPRNIAVRDNVIIKKGAQICSCNENSKVRIGENTTIGFYTFVYASKSITIGSNCLIAPFVYIVDSDHSIDKNTLINQQPNISAPIVIEDDVWIGTGAKILKGVTLSKGSVVAAGSVVKESTEAYGIYGGIPAKKISERK